MDATDRRCVGRSARGVWATGWGLGHTSDRRALRKAGIRHRNRPRGRLPVRRLRANTPDPSAVCSRESGVVLSRYDGVRGYDWIAIPLVPYLYAVERPEDVPLYANAKTVAFLRDRYRRKYLKDVGPDLPNGQRPGGNWYELFGSSYDRTTYSFEIETSGEQDEALILKLNSSLNPSHFHLLTRNCADFVKDLINLYQPKALHRSYVADVGISTPKQMAKALEGDKAAIMNIALES
jgi:hypothetical protein